MEYYNNLAETDCWQHRPPGVGSSPVVKAFVVNIIEGPQSMLGMPPSRPLEGHWI